VEALLGGVHEREGVVRVCCGLLAKKGKHFWFGMGCLVDKLAKFERMEADVRGKKGEDKNDVSPHPNPDIRGKCATRVRTCVRTLVAQIQKFHVPKISGLEVFGSEKLAICLRAFCSSLCIFLPQTSK
jgi:hypothetical protein